VKIKLMRSKLFVEGDVGIGWNLEPEIQPENFMENRKKNRRN
jgi:hypothetical protein